MYFLLFFLSWPALSTDRSKSQSQAIEQIMLEAIYKEQGV